MNVAGASTTPSGGAGSPGAGGTAAGGSPAGGGSTAAEGGAAAGGAASGGTATGGAAAGGTAAGGAAVGGTAAGGMGANAGGMGAGGMTEAGALVLTAPWMHVEECSKSNRDACADIPLAYRRPKIGGPDNVPTLSWTAGPSGTKSYALTFYDTKPPDIVHWAAWNIPAETTSYGAGNTPPAAKKASFDNPEWAGPGSCSNVYELTVYALSVAEYKPDGDHKSVHGGLEGADANLVLSKDVIRAAPLAPCGN